MSVERTTRTVRTIALLVPVTSRGRTVREAADTDLLRTLVPSVLDTATWTARLAYRLYVGYDAGDPFYDRADSRRALRHELRRRIGDRPVQVVLRRSTGTDHAPCAVWNALFRRAYDDGCDFFYQLGDDVRLETGGWARDFPAALLLNPVYPGLGVTGPQDANVPGFPVLTQACVSRVHMAIFGTLYPPAFRNWFSDNWLTEVYAPGHVRRWQTHRARNAGGAERYTIDDRALDLLNREVPPGRRRLQAWLAWSGRPRAARPRRRVIAFSLWGHDTRYLDAAVRTAGAAARRYPGWRCRFYVADTVPSAAVRALSARRNVDVVVVHEPGDWRASLWRYRAASDEDVAVLLVRDVDARLAGRPAIDRWLSSDRDFHVLSRDDARSIPPGGWGVRRGLLWNMRDLLAAWPSTTRRDTAARFLRERVAPLVRDTMLVHRIARAGAAR